MRKTHKKMMKELNITENDLVGNLNIRLKPEHEIELMYMTEALSSNKTKITLMGYALLQDKFKEFVVKDMDDKNVK